MKKNIMKIVSMLFLGSLLVTACKKEKKEETKDKKEETKENKE